MIHPTDDDARFMLLLTKGELDSIKRSMLKDLSVFDDEDESALAKLLVPYKIRDVDPFRLIKFWWSRALGLIGGSYAQQKKPRTHESSR